MRGWHRNGNECEKKKREQTLHICSSNAPKGTPHRELRAPEPPSTHLHSQNVADSNRAVDLSEGESPALSSGTENPSPSRHLPPKQCQPLHAKGQQAACSAGSVVESTAFLHTRTEVSLLFAQSVETGPVCYTRTCTLGKGVLSSSKTTRTADKALAAENLKAMIGINTALCPIYSCCSAKHLSSLLRVWPQLYGPACLQTRIHSKAFCGGMGEGGRRGGRETKPLSPPDESWTIV